MQTPQMGLTARAILAYLRNDAIKTGMCSHFDPSWFSELLGVSGQDVYLASSELVALGLVEIYEPSIVDAEAYPCRISDIVLTREGLRLPLQFLN